MQKITVTVRLDKMVIDELDRHVNGVKFRSRTHAIELMIRDYLDRLAAEKKGTQTNWLDIKPPRKGKK